ncbi:MAG: ABC transporter permease [Bacteroidetes bacterium]|nr:ABC transporter permease [Bacteroidota bacterium]
MTPLRLAILNLTRRKLTTFFAVLSISISVASSGLLLRSYILSNSRLATLGKGCDAVVGAKNSGIEILLGSLNGEGDFPDFVPYALFESLRKEQHGEGVYVSSGIKSVIPFLYFGKFKNYRVIGTDESFFKRPQPAPDLDFAQGTWAANPDEVVIGSYIADKENVRIGDYITVSPWLGKSEERKFPEFKLKVTGILDRTKTVWDYSLFSNVKQAQDIYRQNLDSAKISIWGYNVLNYFLIYTDFGSRKPLTDLINKRTVAQVIYVNEEISKLEGLLSSGKNLGLFITLMIILLGGLVVSVLMITRFDAMKIQLAVLRAIGYKKGEIAKWLLWEGILLGVTSCLAGALFDMMLFPALKGAIGMGLPETVFASSTIFQSIPIWIITIAATCIAAYIPFVIFNTLNVHDSLRGL